MNAVGDVHAQCAALAAAAAVHRLQVGKGKEGGWGRAQGVKMVWERCFVLQSTPAHVRQGGQGQGREVGKAGGAGGGGVGTILLKGRRTGRRGGCRLAGCNHGNCNTCTVHTERWMAIAPMCSWGIVSVPVPHASQGLVFPHLWK